VFRDVCVDAHYAEYEADAYARMNALTDAVLRRSSVFIKNDKRSAHKVVFDSFNHTVYLL
jgi:hypothetical protein